MKRKSRKIQIIFNNQNWHWKYCNFNSGHKPHFSSVVVWDTILLLTLKLLFQFPFFFLLFHDYCISQCFSLHTFEVPNRRAFSLKVFSFSFHPSHSFSCIINEKKSIYLVTKQVGWHFFSSPARLFREN